MNRGIAINGDIEPPPDPPKEDDVAKPKPPRVRGGTMMYMKNVFHYGSAWVDFGSSNTEEL